jgi:EKC/KEOPS complex subunit CGI121/TPRKB
MIDGVR